MPQYDVVLKQVGPQLVAGVRDRLASYPEVGRLLGEVFEHLTHAGVDPSSLINAAIWHDDEYKTSDIDGEAVVFLKSPVPASARVRVYELPAATMASVIYKGAYNKFSQPYEALARWIEANGYTVVGPNREIYLECSMPVRQDDESYVTEIQFPVAKKA